MAKKPPRHKKKTGQPPPTPRAPRPQEAIQTCSACGEALRPEGSFCPRCGKSTTERPASRTWFALAIVALAISSVMSLMLVLDHIGGLSLPGCGPDSDCADAANSVWGKIPITGDFDWPVSFLGLAYFLAALVGWLGSSRGLTPVFRNIVRLGAVISLGFVVILIKEGHLCWYCLAAHAGNLAFWIVVEKTSAAATAAWRPLLKPALVFLVASVILGAVESREEQVFVAEQEVRLEESTAEIIAATADKADAMQERASGDPEPAPRIAETAAAEGSTEQAAATVADTVTAETTEAGKQPGEAIERPWEGGFRGRYLYGPEEAPIRLVMFTDYQCVDCNKIEDGVRVMLHTRKDVSLSIKHFPMCPDCNRHFQKKKHPNACWAARAAEAAGILGGNEGFWKMHFWLFDHDGGFTDQVLQEGLRELGFDPNEFIEVLTSDETLARVHADIEEAIWLGLHYTPMVFINGVELKGVFAPSAIPRAVTRVAAQNPPPMTHALDQPPPAVEKYVSDWRESRVRRMPDDRSSWAKGPANAKVQIVVWGDYMEPITTRAAKEIARLTADRTDVRYAFRHYPIHTECNPTMKRDLNPLSCRSSKAVEAAGVLGGLEGFWRMHDWVLGNQERFSDTSLRAAAAELGLDADDLLATMESPAVQRAIEEDCRAGKQMSLRGVPMIYVNNKFVPRWDREGENVLERIIRLAGGQ